MFSKKVKSRMVFLIFSFLFLALIVFFILRSLEENVVYFFSPTEIYNKSDISLNKKIRVGGLVKEKSVKHKENIINFTITDLKNEIVVSYTGLVPNLFSKGKGVVVEGKLKDKKYFISKTRRKLYATRS